jgi:glutathione peroxidase
MDCEMTLRQTFLKTIYPVWVWLAKITGKRSDILKNVKNEPPPQSIYDLSVQLNDGKTLPLQTLKGKKILLVNTASDCGYTGQYSALQNLYKEYNGKLLVIGFPANDFAEQEKGDNKEIAQFCQVNFGVTFPLAAKSIVVSSQEQNPIYQWLTDKSRNGWNSKAPSWNFSKYLINEQGVLTHYFDPAVSPDSKEVIEAIT